MNLKLSVSFCFLALVLYGCSADVQVEGQGGIPSFAPATDTPAGGTLQIGTQNDFTFNRLFVKNPSESEVATDFIFIAPKDQTLILGVSTLMAEGCDMDSLEEQLVWLTENEKGETISFLPVTPGTKLETKAGTHYRLVVAIKNTQNCSNLDYQFKIQESS